MGLKVSIAAAATAAANNRLTVATNGGGGGQQHNQQPQQHSGGGGHHNNPHHNNHHHNQHQQQQQQQLNNPDRSVITIKQEIPSGPAGASTNPGQHIDPAAGFVDSTTAFLPPNGANSPSMSSISEETIDVRLQNDPVRIQQHLSETVLSAHTLTCLMDSKYIKQAALDTPINQNFLQHFKNKVFFISAQRFLLFLLLCVSRSVCLFPNSAKNG